MPRSDARRAALALTDDERAARDARMLDLAERGWTQRRIAAAYGVSQICVVKALLRARVVEADRLDT